MSQHSWKIDLFYFKVKANWKRNLFNETELGNEDSLDIWDLNLLQAFAIVFLSRVPPGTSSLGSGTRICCEALKWPLIQRRPAQNNPETIVEVEVAGRPDLLICRKIRRLEGNAKCCHPKNFTCKGTLRQVFICLMPRIPTPTHLTHCIRLYSTVYLFTQGSGEKLIQNEG
jgi:hypothetical protein